jgi:hypothetical protein
MGLKDKGSKLTRKIRSLLLKKPGTNGSQECDDPEHDAESHASGPSPMPPDIPADPGDTDISFDHGDVGVTAASTGLPRSEVVHNWLSGLKLAVQVFEKTLDSVPVPGLKGAIGGILMIVDQFEVTRNFLLALPASTKSI